MSEAVSRAASSLDPLFQPHIAPTAIPTTVDIAMATLRRSKV